MKIVHINFDHDGATYTAAIEYGGSDEPRIADLRKRRDFAAGDWTWVEQRSTALCPDLADALWYAFEQTQDPTNYEFC